MQSWADAEWFTKRDELPESLKMVVFKVTVKQILTTCLLRLMHGLALISRSMLVLCTK